MEQDFGAEDLEDGELWLPPDFFSMEEAQTSSTDFNYSSDTITPFCMDDFDLTSFAFLSPHNPALFKPLQSLLQFDPAVLYNSTSVNNFCCCCCRTGTGMIRNQPVYLNPVDAFMGQRAWALLLHREQQNRFELNRVRPGGTGVFLPRISETSTIGINRMGQGVKYKRGLPPRKRMLNKRPND